MSTRLLFWLIPVANTEEIVRTCSVQTSRTNNTTSGTISTLTHSSTLISLLLLERFIRYNLLREILLITYYDIFVIVIF